MDSLRVASVELRAGDIQCDRYHGAALSCVALQFRNASTGAEHRRGEGVKFEFRQVTLVARLDVFLQDIQSEAGVLSAKEGREECVSLTFEICCDSVLCCVKPVKPADVRDVKVEQAKRWGDGQSIRAQPDAVVPVAEAPAPPGC